MFKFFNLLVLSCLILMACQSNTQESTRQQSPEAEEQTSMENPANTGGKTILFFGNSITEGYQLEQSEAFPALLQGKIDSLGLAYTTINAGLSGETSSGGLGRIKWLLQQQVDVFVLELGANDGLRGIDPEETDKNLRAILTAVQEAYPQVKVLLCGMQVPPNMGEDYANKFKTIFPGIANDFDVSYLPFLLDGVAGIPELNLSDGIHPTPEGHKIVAANIWDMLEPLL